MNTKQMFILGLYLLTSTCGYAETYNFYFQNKENKGEMVREEKGEKEVKEVVVPAPPIEQAPPVIEKKTEAPSQPATVIDASLNRSRFLLHLGAMYMPTESSTKPWQNPSPSNGVLVGLQVEFTSRWYAGVFLGNQRKDQYASLYGGAETEYRLLQVGFNSSYQTIELGPIVGISTLNAPNVLAYFAGVRAHLNLSDHFGFIGTARANLGYSQYEVGFLARL